MIILKIVELIETMLLVKFRSIVVFILCGVPFFTQAQTAKKATFDFNKNCEKAYHQIIGLRIKNGSDIIAAEKKLNPNNPVVYYLEHEKDFMLFFIEEKESDFNHMIKEFDNRFSKVENADVHAPLRRYLMAQMQLEVAISKGKLGQFMTAFFYVRRGYNLLLENQKEFPNYTPNLIGLGLFHALIGTVPQKYMWGVNMMGFYGNLEQGMGELLKVQEYAQKTPLYCQEELDFIYVYGLLYMMNDKKGAWDKAKVMVNAHSDNLLYTFLGATVAFASNYNDDALKLLQNRPKGPEYMRFSYLDYMYGLAKLRRLDKDAAFYFEKFLLDRDRRNFVKDAYQKLAWCHLLNGNMEGYHKALADCAVRGNAVVDADKQAQRELESKDIPNLTLLRARLLCDGGYYEKAIGELNGKKMDDFSQLKEKVEFVYRAGRIYHEWGYPDKAIPYYNLATKYGANLPQWYEASAAVNLGLIYEQKGNKELAKKYFQECIDSKNTDFKNGLEQKARSGLERLKKKK